MDLQELKKLIAVFEKSGVHELEIEEDGHRVLLKKESAQLVQQVTSPVVSAVAQTTMEQTIPSIVDDSIYVKAPLVGTFYASPNPQSKAYVVVGQSVSKGDVVCLVEAMKVMNEIKAPSDGIVKSILLESGAMVEFNQRLIELGAL